MGAPSAQVQPSQSSAPAGKGASTSPSSAPMGKGSMSAISGQPTIGQPNTNSNTGMAVADPTLTAPYANTVGQSNTTGQGDASLTAPAVIDNQPRVNQGPRFMRGGKGKGV